MFEGHAAHPYNGDGIKTLVDATKAIKTRKQAAMGIYNWGRNHKTTRQLSSRLLQTRKRRQ